MLGTTGPPEPRASDTTITNATALRDMILGGMDGTPVSARLHGRIRLGILRELNLFS